MVSTETRELIQETITIPTLPALLARLNAVLAREDAGTREVGDVIAEDPATATKVLRVANTAFYGLREPVLSVRHAASVLGVDVLRNLVLQASLIRDYERLEVLETFDIRQVWEHSILTAQVSQLLARRSRPGPDTRMKLDEYYTCGLLHDVGKVVMVDALGEPYLEVLGTARREGTPSYLHEKKVFGYTHGEVGGTVAYLWRLPDPAVGAIECHHHPRTRIRRVPEQATVALADEIANVLEAAANGRQRKRPDPTLVLSLGLSTAALNEVMDLARLAQASITI